MKRGHIHKDFDKVSNFFIGSFLSEGKFPLENDVEVIILTPSELEARERKAFMAARENIDWKDLYEGPTFREFEDYKNSEEYKQ